MVEHMDRFDDASKFGESAGEWCGAFLHLENTHDRIGLDATELEGAGEAQEVWPSGGNPFGIDLVAGEPVDAS